MPRYNVTTDFSVETEVECDFGYAAFSNGDAEEFSDESYFSTQSVEADGGNLRFVVEAEDAAMAEENANHVVYDGMEIEDNNGLTWAVSNVSFDIEVIEEPMTLDKALALIREFIASMEGMDDELKEAFNFVLDYIPGQPRV